MNGVGVSYKLAYTTVMGRVSAGPVQRFAVNKTGQVQKMRKMHGHKGFARSNGSIQITG